jgi:hypothetical protein
MNRLNPLWWLLGPDRHGRLRSASRHTRNRRHLKGGQKCAESKFYSQHRHCSRAWPWRQLRTRKSSSASAFNQPAPMDTTTTLRTPARPWDFMGRGTSTTVSFWAWVPGPDGAMATAGAVIASVKAAAEAIAAMAVTRPAAVITAAVLKCAAAAAADMPTQRLPMAAEHAPAHPMATAAAGTQRQRIATAAAADMPAAVAVDTPAAANTGNP